MRVTTADGTEIWWQHEGRGPAVLLVPGRGDATDLFPEELTTRLRDNGLSTLRYDPRDTGLSDDGGDTYTMSTMADDSVAVLDAAGLDAVHIIGVSMAGLIMIDLAARHPERVASLLFVSAMSPDPDAGMGEDFFLGIEGGDPLDNYLRSMGEVSDEDRAWVVEEVEAASRRAPARPEAASRHQEAAFRLDWPTLEDLGRISAPTAVIHGRLDRMLPGRARRGPRPRNPRSDARAARHHGPHPEATGLGSGGDDGRGARRLDVSPVSRPAGTS